MKVKLTVRAKMLIGLFILVGGFIFTSFLIMYKLYIYRDVLLNELHVDADLLKSTDELIQYNLNSTIVLVLIGFGIVFFIANSLTKPIRLMASAIDKLSDGEIPEINTENISSDELGQMQLALSKYLDGLKQTAQFAVKIGKGELDAKFNPLSTKDLLGSALLDMRDNLRKAFIRDEERNKIVLCNAEVSNILRSNTQLDVLGLELLKYLTSKTRSIQGAFYIVNENQSGEKEIVLTSTFAYNKKKTLKKTFRFAEGLVGQAAIEMDMVHRTEIPRDYVTLTSGLITEQRPQSILIMPLITNEKVFGVLEFASAYKYTTLEIDIVKNVSEIIAQTIFNLQVNERTTRLLLESQRMSSELQEQSEVLQQNAVEMQKNQEELRRSNQKLEIQIEEVNKSQKRTQVLLQNSSEVITICDQKGNITYVSPSVDHILGYSPQELIGTNDDLRLDEQGKQIHTQMIQSLLNEPKKVWTSQYSYKKKNGEYVWLEVTAKNLLDDDAIQGLVFNARDITERRLAEREARMRSQMQSLSENSPDLIARLGKEGRFYYVNPTIEKLTRKKPDNFNQRTIFETDLHPSVVQTWHEVIENVLKSKNKVQVEMPFPTENGSLVMSVNAIPEYNDEQSLESILLVSNDITERKKAELEIQTQNRKITESINYAQRIQAAILPEQARISALLPEYFMLYKPRDVVSGDFPWFVEAGDDLYLAAVDCTGHGVPGAMLSLIGYFLLNDIVKSQGISTPGIILDMLDQSVTRTLKQNIEGNEMKDGMDISLCKINKKSMRIEYAGAHRPLYQFRNGEVLEFKGNKFPIGGGVYKNQTNFTNYEISIQKGDAFFFCSDGLPDQFGGAENKKIGPARIKAMIADHAATKDFKKLEKIFDSFFTQWKGDSKQLDDILLIGLRF